MKSIFFYLIIKNNIINLSSSTTLTKTANLTNNNTLTNKPVKEFTQNSSIKTKTIVFCEILIGNTPFFQVLEYLIISLNTYSKIMYLRAG